MIYHRSWRYYKNRVYTEINGKVQAKKMWEEEDDCEEDEWRPRRKEVYDNGINGLMFHKASSAHK